MDLQETIKKIGLSETEAKIYINLLKIKEATAVKLAKETEVHRRTIYDNLNILFRKGLVSFKIRNGVKYFQATNPKSLKIFIEEKTKILDDVLPSLQDLYKSDTTTPKISVFVGKEGAKALVEEIVNYKETSYWVGGGLFFFKSLKYSRGFIEKKFKKMKLKTVQPNIPESKELFPIINKNNIRLLPKNFVSKVGYLVYGNIVALGVVQDEEITTIKIESKEFSQAFKNYFNVMWSFAKPIK